MRVRSVLAAVVIAVAAAPLAAQATLYKWTDENGVVNYGDAPPNGTKKATTLNEASSSLSVYPGMTKEELARARESDAQYRIQQLERENAELRARAYAPPPPLPPVAYDSQLAYDPYLFPLVITRRAPPRNLHAPRHDRHPQGKPVQRTPPMRGMSAQP